VTNAKRQELLALAGSLEALLERETTLRGEALRDAVEQKKQRIEQLKQALDLQKPGAFERAQVLQGRLKNLGIANNVALKMAKIRLTFSRLRNGPATGRPASRVDILS
jgi:hypothetical protein